MALKSTWSGHEGINEYSNSVHGRVVATYQERVAQDFPYSDFFVRLKKPSALQQYFLIARTCQAQIPFLEEKKVRVLTDEQGALTGEIVIVPSDKSKSRKKFVESLKSSIEDWDQEGSSFLDRMSKKISSAHKDNVVIFRIDFCLFRTGEVRIWFDPLKQSNNLSNVKDSEMESIAKQAYYFLKDIAHAHYHHEPDSDQLIELVRLTTSSNQSEHERNEIAWKREVLWGFARVIAQLRRNNDLRSLKRVQGILAYADAFQSNVAVIRRAKALEGEFEIDRNLTIYDFGHAKTSIAALDNFRTWYNTGSFQLLATILALMLSALSLWAAVTRIAISDCDTNLPCVGHLSNEQMQVVSYVALHPLLITGVLLFPAMFLYFVFVRDVKAFRPTKKFDRFIRTGSSAIGAGVAEKSGNVYLGFFTSVLIYVVILSVEVIVLAALTVWLW